MAVVQGLVYFIAGGVTAGIYLMLLWRSVAALVQRRSYRPWLMGTLARFGLLFAAAALAVRSGGGTVELLLGVMGFVLVRFLVLKAMPSLSRDMTAWSR